ncbi:hypothetical protein [Comamonas sp. JC664]|uniref:hypothetical protein n=1 Tax=Comamonas sp. JC664 TaxID=2801917 RepID=UPI00174DC207|nr:hypothetical protein [Comamonas sp. JC664]MBL0694189.1 hypothetical protein [Comamonas sp. JC664]GHG76225.1 hypothetical protein GCM10012319_25190 [Comamonas sp. KCTC 72670]
MTKHWNRFLAGSMLSLFPASALAAPLTAADFPERPDYVSIRAESIEVPARKSSSTALVTRALQNHLVLNQTGTGTYLGITLLTDTLIGEYGPYPVRNDTYGGHLLSAPLPTPGSPVIQQYYWTDNPTAPAAGRTCLYEVEVYDIGGSCAAHVSSSPYNGANCPFNMSMSYIDTTTCEIQVVWDHW